jgi:hypothetical protein
MTKPGEQPRDALWCVRNLDDPLAGLEGRVVQLVEFFPPADEPGRPLTQDDRDRLTMATCRWMASNLCIRSDSGSLIALDVLHDPRFAGGVNPVQYRVLFWLCSQLLAGLPARIIILKSRKMGCSTVVEAFGYMLAHLFPNTRALVCAQTDEDSQTLFSMTSMYQSENPTARQLDQGKPGKKEMRWSRPHRSVFQVQTAGRTSLKRGDTLTFVHCSEVPSWRNAKKTLNSVSNAVPRTGPNVIVIESTASGWDEFKSRWDSAVEYRKQNTTSLAGYMPLFFSWLSFASYAAEPPPGYAWGLMSEKELALQSIGATLQQLYWRRRTIEDNEGGDEELFAVEFPSSPAEAFSRSGRRRIPAGITDRHRRCVLTGAKFRFQWEPDGTVSAHEGDYITSYWEIYQPPAPYHDYAIGGDVAEGKLSDPDDDHSEHDRTRGFVLDRVTLHQVARWEGPEISETEFGRQLHLCAVWYNRAWVTPEVNNTGKATVLVLVEAGYERLYRRMLDMVNVEGGAELAEYGFRTTSSNRERIVIEWKEACRAGPDGGYEGRITPHSAVLVNEEETFIITMSGRSDHARGQHDDELFAAMIALQVHKDCPRTRTTPEEEGFVMIETAAKGYMQAGGIDNMDEALEEDETT